MKQISLKEIYYYLFFGLLFAAKGIGLYDGQGVFKIVLVIALFFWMGKMVLTSYRIKEIFIIVALLILGVLSYYFSGDKAAMIAIMTITGMKDIPIKRLFKIGLVIWSVTFIGTVGVSLLGLKDTVQFVHNKAGLGFVIRDSLGMTHPNVLHISYMVLVALWFLAFDFKGKSLAKAIGLSFVGSLFIFMYSLSYTGFLFLIAYFVLIIYLNWERKKTRVENIVIQCLMPACVLFAILGPVTLKGKLFDLVNKAVNTRFELSRHYLTTLLPGLFGTQVNIEGNYTIDCSYIHCLYYYGILLFLFFVAGFFLLIRHLLKHGHNQELAMTLGLIAAGFTEPFLFNFSYKNIIFPLMGEVLFVYLETAGKIPFLEKKFSIIKKEFVYNFSEIPALKHFSKRLCEVARSGKKMLVAGVVSGILAGSVIGSVCVHVEPYVVVNKNTSDRVGKKGDYQIYGELSDEIIEHSLKVNVYDEDTKVFVLSGSITEYQEIREKIVVCFGGGVLGAGIVTVMLLMIQNRKKYDKDSDVG